MHRKGRRKRLALTPGRHIVRVAEPCGSVDGKSKARPVSRAVAIEILDASGKPAAGAAADAPAGKPADAKPVAGAAAPAAATEPSAAERLAEKYYKSVDEILLAEKAESERDRKAMGDKTIPVPSTATGVVRARFGGPVAGAEITITPEVGEGVLGSGKTHAEGRFKINLLAADYRGVTLEVKAKGFVRWAFGGIYGGIVGHLAVLDREIDDDRLAAVLAEKDPERRLEGVLEIVASRQMSDLGIEQVFPYIGKLRADLRTIIAARVFDRKDDGGESPADRARWLLAYWADPADEAVVEPWMKDNAYIAPAPPEIVGATIEDACRRYADAFFGNEPANQRTLSNFSNPRYSLEKDRALIEFSVHYLNWGFSQYLVLVKEGDQPATARAVPVPGRRVKLVAEHMHWDRGPVAPLPGK